MPGASDANDNTARRRTPASHVVAVVVLGLIILTSFGILFSSVAERSRYGGKARRAQCISHLKQIALACRLYAGDWGDRYPTALEPRNFEDQMLPYVKKEALLVCPSAPDEPAYLFNRRFAGNDTNRVEDAAAKPMVWDAGARPGNAYPFPGTTTNRHMGGDNVAFADAHAKWLRAEEMSGLSLDPAEAVDSRDSSD